MEPAATNTQGQVNFYSSTTKAGTDWPPSKALINISEYQLTTIQSHHFFHFIKWTWRSSSDVGEHQIHSTTARPPLDDAKDYVGQKVLRCLGRAGGQKQHTSICSPPEWHWRGRETDDDVAITTVTLIARAEAPFHGCQLCIARVTATVDDRSSEERDRRRTLDYHTRTLSTHAALGTSTRRLLYRCQVARSKTEVKATIWRSHWVTLDLKRPPTSVKIEPIITHSTACMLPA